LSSSYVPPAEDDPPEIMPYLWHDVRPGMLAFEVGANQGQSLPRLLRLFRRVVAFEPFEPSFALASQVADADVRQQAVSDHDGEVALRLVEHQFRTDRHEAAERIDFTALPEITVPCVSLDTLAEAEGIPDFVNMDVEGSELHVLQGAPKVLAAGRTQWLIEFHSAGLHADCLEILSAHCSHVETVRHPHYLHGSRVYYEHGWLKCK
jgi:FkbM family methyltransferase